MRAAVAFVAVVVLANWAIQAFGVVPVGFGLYAPAAVYLVGVTFTLRDLIPHRRYVFAAIAVAGAITWAFNGGLALASTVAFVASETADYAVYSRIRRRGWMPAVIASNAVGLVIDSALFLWLAFGSFDFLPGQIVGKATMTLVAVVAIAIVRARYRAAVPA